MPSDNSLTGTFSPRFNSEPPSLAESMQMMDEILSDQSMDRVVKLDKLEAILSAVTQMPNDQVSARDMGFLNEFPHYMIILTFL